MKYWLLLFSVVLSLTDIYAQKGKFNEFSLKCTDNIERPYIIYTPEKVTSKSPLLVYLHGAISSKHLKKDPLAYMKRSPLIKVAEKGGFRLLFSFGQKNATWFDTVGVNMVLDEIEDITANFKIDKNKIFLSGFSDGGSGTLYFSMTQPHLFAGFISMNGHLKVATQLGTSLVYPQNMNNKPLYIINTKGDLLYPSDKLKPIIGLLKENNSKLSFIDLEGNHEMSYLSYQQDSIIEFIRSNYRQSALNISWESADLFSNTIDWLTIKKIDTTITAQKWHSKYKLKLFNDKASFGIKYDYSYQGKGLKVAGFKSDSCTAQTMKVHKGDIIILMEQDSIKNGYSPYYYKAKKKAGEQTSITLLRDGEKKVLQGQFSKGYSYELFDKKIKSAKILASYAHQKINIKTSCVAQFTIDFSQLPLINNNSIEVSINGKTHRVKPKGIKEFNIN